MQQGFKAEIPLGYAQAPLSATGQTLAQLGVTLPQKCSLILFQCEAQGARWRDDGVLPTSTVGYPMAAGNEFRYTGTGSLAIAFAQQSAGSILNMVFYA